MKSKFFGWEFRKGIEDATHKIVSVLKLRKVTISWKNISTACIDSKGRILLADIPDDAVVDRALFMRYMGFVVHELLHRKYTTFGGTYSCNYVRQLANGLEDARIENLAISANLTGNISELLTVLADAMVAESLEHVTDWSNPAQFPFVLAMLGRKHVKRKVPVHPLVRPIFDEAIVRLNTCGNSFGVNDIAEWVYDQLQKTAEENPPTDTPKDAPTDAPEGESGEGSGSGDTDADADADGDTGDGTEGVLADGLSKPNPDNAVCPEPTLDAPDGVGGGISWSPDQHVAKDGAYVDQYQPHPSWDIKSVGGAKLRYEVRRLFEMSGVDEFQHNRRHGQLDGGNLHTIAVGNDRVFKRHHEEGGIDSAVVLIIDCSGSMFDDRMRSAAPVLATLMDTLDRAGVATSVVSFGTQVSLVKPFGMTVKKANYMIERLYSGGDNSDQQALRYAHNMLLNRTEQRKVVFVLGDGGVTRDQERECKAQAKSGERLGITTIGVGIQADLSRMYPNNITIRSLDELANASFKQIKLAA